MLEKNERRLAVLLIVLTLLIRGSVLFSDLGTFDADPDDYGRLAKNWNEFGVFGTEGVPTAFRPPLYPLLLSGLDVLQIDETKSERLNSLLLSRNASVALLHWGLGLATVLLVFQTANRGGLSGKASFFAAFLVAVDPILLQQSRLVMTETLATFFAAVLLAVLVLTSNLTGKRRRGFAVVLGVLFGFAVLCRPTFLAFAGLVFLGLLRKDDRENVQESTTNAPSGDRSGWETISNERKAVENGSELRNDREWDRNGSESANLAQSNDSSFLSERSDVERRRGWGIWGVWGNERRESLIAAIFFLVGLAVPLIPWGVRNKIAFDRPILTTTHSGYTLLLANNDFLYDYYNESRPWRSLWNPEPFHADWEKQVALVAEDARRPNPIEVELKQDRLAKKTAWNVVERRPCDFLLATVYRIGNLWQVLPYRVSDSANESVCSKAARFAVALFYAAELAFALIGTAILWSRRKENRRKTSLWFWGFLLILSVQIPHLLFWTNMRMRAPLMIFVPILAAFAVSRLFLKNFVLKTERRE